MSEENVKDGSFELHHREREIKARQRRLLRDYPGIWERMLSSWAREGDRDQVWLTYSHSYLFRTGGIRWAIDLAL